MKILITGSKNPYAFGSYISKYLSQINGVELSKVFTFDTAHNYIQKGALNRVISFFSAHQIEKRISNEILENIDEFKPDLFFVFKGYFIKPEVLAEIKNRGVLLVNYNPDHPLEFFSKATGNKNISSSIKYYDLYITYSKRIEEQLLDSCQGLKVAVVPFGFEHSNYTKSDLNDLKSINKACFVGRADSIRAHKIKSLLKSGVPVDVYGDYWGKYLSNHDLNGLRIYPGVYKEEYWKVLQKYDLQINVFRPHNVDSHNMRTFEVPAVGGLQLAQESTDHRAYFKPDREIFLFKKESELVNKAKWILGLEKRAKVELRNEARKRCLKDGYSYQERAKQIFEHLNRL